MNKLLPVLAQPGLLAAALMCGLSAMPFSMSAQADDWPSRPVRILVGAPAGGGTDVVARMLAEKYRPELGQNFIVENRPGAATTLAADATAKAPPDGYTLLVATNTAQVIAPHMMKLAYDPLRDLEPIALIVQVPNLLLINNKIPARNVRELIDLAKASPGRFSFGSSGFGSTQHLGAVAFARAMNLELTHVPYKGSSQTLTDLMGGHIQMTFENTSSSISLIRSGEVRALAVMSSERSKHLPDVPTLRESGVDGIEMSTWYALFVPKGTPKPIITKLTEATTRVLAMPDVIKQVEGLAGESGRISAQELAEVNANEFERFGKLIREIGSDTK